tara:strand:- start:144 stop:1640 length:1497 start_codon:yes stop_codon:yes gene_type:complete
MLKLLIFLVFLASSSVFVAQAFSLEVEVQKESERIIESMGWITPDIHTFQEQFQLIIDETNQKNRLSIGLLTTNPNDIIFPDNIEIMALHPKVFSFTLTNQFGCAPNNFDKACIIIALEREGLGDNLEEIKKNTRAITDEMVADGAILFAPEFDSVVIQPKTSYLGGEKVVISQAVYTANKQSTNKLFTALSTMLLSDEVRTSGGFYDYAEKLSEKSFAEFTVTLVPLETNSLRSLHVSFVCSNEIAELPRCDLDGNISQQIKNGNINPLDFIQAENLNRSKIFTDEFLPLNSIVQVIIFSDQDLQVKSVNSNLIKKLENLGDIQDSGWVFTSMSGQKIDARYIFGSDYFVSGNRLSFSIGPNSGDSIEIKEVKDSGGCLIATAAFDSELAPQVQLLREIRDNTVLQTESGHAFMTGFNQFYYAFSPAIADYERENPVFKEAVKITLTPLLTSLTLLQYADIDSESEMLGYGIGIILLNIGMYFVAPAILITKAKKKI